MSLDTITLDGISIRDAGGGELRIAIGTYTKHLPYDYARELAHHMLALCDTGRLDPRYLAGKLASPKVPDDPALTNGTLKALPIIDIEG